MWRFKPFTHRESASLEGRSIDVGNVKVHVRNLIAEGGFSCVYLARDALHSSRLYGLKHIFCNDGESLELVMKEISVMKLLNGHPNIIKLISYAIMDMGRIKEALLVMEFCDRSLVTFLERGAHFLEEKHILLIFRDVCNAVFAMHNQNPPIAHRDLKAENVLLGADGAWKLCDFGSTSSNHKSFTRPEEMGIEEDNIRKHTTPAYRAPEMWDLYRRDIISEKVDIWALGCLLYRICFLKSAFDGESKLQITNVNYHIPELPKYSAAMIGLIKDMFQGSPDARPDITQVWFRVNQLLPMDLQKDLPDGSSLAKDKCPHTAMLHQEGFPKGVDMMLRRGSPLASNECSQRTTSSSNKEKQQPKLPQSSSKANGGAQIGSFWYTQQAPNSQVIPDKALPNGRGHEITVSPMEKQHIAQQTKLSHNEIKAASQNNYFDASGITLNTTQQSSSSSSTSLSESKPVKEEQNVEVKNLKDQLKQVNLEKAEIFFKYEKLTAICRSQRQEIQELKCALATFTRTSSSKDCSKSQITPVSLQSTTSQKEKLDPNLLELEQAMLASSTATLPAPGEPPASAVPSQVPKPWQAFDDEPKAKPWPNNNFSGLSWPINGGQSTWGFIQGNNVSAHSQMPSTAAPSWGSSSQRFGGGLEKKLSPNQPSTWTGF